MELSSLAIIHVQKQKQAGQLYSIPTRAFHMNTCQRLLWIGNRTELEKIYQSFDSSSAAQAEFAFGTGAYELLLRIATGMESQIQGETDIFGQLKKSWTEFDSPELKQDLRYWVEKVFEDTKEIRTHYIQGAGGSSYGSLVRRLLNLQTGKKILLVGAGQLAQSVAPYLTDPKLECEIFIANRSQTRLREFIAQLKTQQPLARIYEVGDELTTLSNADHAVYCVPTDSSLDPVRISQWRKKENSSSKLVHLGCLKEEAGMWQTAPQFYSLTDLFGIQSEQSGLRGFRIGQAKKACLEKARLRSLGGHSTLPHGWEDLFAFSV